MRLVQEAKFPVPFSAEIQIHVGSEDWRSPQAIVQKFGSALNCPVHVARGRGHMLGDEDYVGPVLERWLSHNLEP